MIQKIFLLTLICVLTTAFGCASDGQKAIEVFDAYFAAVEQADGEAAVSYVSQSTIDYYQSLIDLSLDATEPETRALAIADKVTVVMIRHRLPAEVIRSMNGRALFVHAVDNGWVGKQSMDRFKNSGFTMQIEIKGKRAWAYMTNADGAKSDRILAFTQEDGWKLDVLFTLEASAPAMKRKIAASGVDEDVFAGMVAGAKSDMVVTEKVWQPIGRD